MASIYQPELLYSLPTELQLDIISHLDYGGAINLSGVNRHFHHLIDPNEWPAQDKRAFLKRAQHFPQHNVNRSVQHRQANCETVYSVRAGFACFTCFRVRPMHCFGSHNILGYPKDLACTKAYSQHQQQQQQQGGDSSNGTETTRQTARRCLDCSIAANELRHGLEVVVPRQTSTLVDHSRPGEPRVLLVDMMEAEDRVFCDECGELHAEELWLRTCARNLEPRDDRAGLTTLKDGLVVHNAVDHGACYWEMGRA